VTRGIFALSLAVTILAVAPTDAIRVDVLRSAGGLPPHIVGMFENPVGFQQASNGAYYVFDRRGQAVYRIDAARTGAQKIVEIGGEEGRIIQPTGFDVSRDGRIVVADVPRLQQRVQTFDGEGKRLSGFFLPGQPAARVTIGNLMLNGAGSIQHTGGTLLISHPESGSLFTEYSPGGYAQRSIGSMRTTGFEDDPQLHIAMNAGLPLVDPTGGYFFVFITGTPLIRKYDAKGTLVFERHIEGRELDDYLAAQPKRWPRRQVEDKLVPFVTPSISAAAVDDRGELWVSLSVPYTYVYDKDGDKVRTVQFQAAGLINPTSLSFAPGGRLLVTPGCYEFDPR
jgi:hypothetical protein